MSQNTNAIVPQNQSMQAVAALSAGQDNIFSTIQGANHDEKLQILDAITSAEPVSEHLNETINLKNVIVQATTLTDENTGEERDALRTILIDDKGGAYAAVSDGLFKALQNIFAVMGHPNTWESPLPVQVQELKGRKGFRFFTIKMVRG